jgi:hypothetical protein
MTSARMNLSFEPLTERTPDEDLLYMQDVLRGVLRANAKSRKRADLAQTQYVEGFGAVFPGAVPAPQVQTRNGTVKAKPERMQQPASDLSPAASVSRDSAMACTCHTMPDPAPRQVTEKPGDVVARAKEAMVAAAAEMEWPKPQGPEPRPSTPATLPPVVPKYPAPKPFIVPVSRAEGLEQRGQYAAILPPPPLQPVSPAAPMAVIAKTETPLAESYTAEPVRSFDHIMVPRFLRRALVSPDAGSNTTESLQQTHCQEGHRSVNSVRLSAASGHVTADAEAPAHQGGRSIPEIAHAELLPPEPVGMPQKRRRREASGAQAPSPFPVDTRFAPRSAAAPAVPMTLPIPPVPGTTEEERLAELRAVPFRLVKDVLSNGTYTQPNGCSLRHPHDVGRLGRDSAREMVLNHEVERGFLAKDITPAVADVSAQQADVVRVPQVVPEAIPSPGGWLQVPPVPGTSAQARMAELKTCPYVRVRKAVSETYRRPNGAPVFTYAETLQANRDLVRQKMLEYEVGHGWLVNDLQQGQATA